MRKSPNGTKLLGSFARTPALPIIPGLVVLGKMKMGSALALCCAVASPTANARPAASAVVRSSRAARVRVGEVLISI